MVKITSFKHKYTHTITLRHIQPVKEEKNVEKRHPLPLIQCTYQLQRCEFNGWTHFWVVSSLLSTEIADCKQFKVCWIWNCYGYYGVFGTAHQKNIYIFYWNDSEYEDNI